MDPQFAALADEIYRDKVRRARAMSPEEKLLAGQRLFAAGCDITRAGIRSQHPEADDAEVERILARRIQIKRQLEEHELKRRMQESQRGVSE